MKKVISIILVATIILSVLIFPVSAVFNDTSGYKYFDKYVKYNGKDCCEGYFELYYHYSSENNEEPDWTLTYSRCMPYYDVKKFGLIVGGRVLWNWGINDPHFSSGFGVYVTELDTFLEVYDSKEQMEKITKYCPDFIDVLEEYGYTTQFGDINYDDTLDIVDVTYIQRMLAGYNDIICIPVYPIDGIDVDTYLTVKQADNIESVGNISDVDRDGETTILDATAMQKMLAGLEI